jgi:hypothetical protein
MDPLTYLTETRSRIAASPVVQKMDIIEQRAEREDGYFRAQLILVNGDFLEVSEYFVLERDSIVPKRYRHQWMDHARIALKQRWDNVRHYPHLPGFPDHVHIGSESNVAPGYPLTVIDLVAIIEQIV